jgi:hypothetical protein
MALSKESEGPMATSKKISTSKRIAPQPVRKNFLLRFANLILIVAVLIVYWPTFSLDYTELDDSIFIKETSDYNKDLSNLATSFQRGVFNATEDIYYRPLLLDSFILNYKMSEDIGMACSECISASYFSVVTFCAAEKSGWKS